MHTVQLDIIHKGCWGSDIHTQFPELAFSSVDCRWIHNQVAHIVLVRGNSAHFKKVLAYLKRRKDVLKIEKLSQDDQSLYVRVLTKKTKHVGQFSDMFFEHGCFPIAPTQFVNTSEIWTLGTSRRENIAAVIKNLKKKHAVKVNSIKEKSIQSDLTKKQREVLTFAKHFGYYEWPRKLSVTEISKLVNIPKTVFLSHLRKAENKIITQFTEMHK